MDIIDDPAIVYKLDDPVYKLAVAICPAFPPCAFHVKIAKNVPDPVETLTEFAKSGVKPKK